MTGAKYIPGKPCAYGNEYCVWPHWLEIDGVIRAKRVGIRTAIQATLKVFEWEVNFFDRRRVNSLIRFWAVCETHSADLFEFFTDDSLTYEDIRDSMRSELYLVDRTFL